LAGEMDVSINVEPPDEAVRVRCDLGRVTQVLGNIIGNAIKFTPRMGSITICSSVAREHVVFAVRDTGTGIAPEHVARLFERNWQAEENAHRGRGLGLFIAKQLVESQGGTIWAESQLGVGTTLFFTLPRAEHSEAGA